MPELKICAALTATEGASLELASQLELDRGCAVIGTVWTKGDMIDYLSNPNNKIFSWTDERSPIAFEDGKPYIPCKYKVLAGISYEISRDDNGRPIYDGKHIVLLTGFLADISVSYAFIVIYAGFDEYLAAVS